MTSKFATNVGSVDRGLRIVLGLVLLGASFLSGAALFQSGAATGIAVLIGLVLIATSAMKFCPLYRILGIRTCKL
ncbi:YgaP family membrane protein [Tateyamaria sp.]|uniref:YgaP family membrane protein n=1 Tax=Tateyamaria sp. TaxID=1929288 RepID=UPI003B215ED0